VSALSLANQSQQAVLQLLRWTRLRDEQSRRRGKPRRFRTRHSLDPAAAWRRGDRGRCFPRSDPLREWAGGITARYHPLKIATIFPAASLRGLSKSFKAIRQDRRGARTSRHRRMSRSVQARRLPLLWSVLARTSKLTWLRNRKGYRLQGRISV